MAAFKRINLEKKKLYSHPLNNYFSFEFCNLCEEYCNITNLREYRTNQYEMRVPAAEILILKNKKIELQINIDKEYPFKPPRLFICKSNILNKDLNYFTWSFKSGEKINKIIKQNNYTSYELLLVWFFVLNKNYTIFDKIPHFSLKIPQDCFCCSSILCSDKWNPSIKITDIIIEFILRKELFNLFTVKGIRYIEKIFKNNRWDLSEDLIYYILEKIIV